MRIRCPGWAICFMRQCQWRLRKTLACAPWWPIRRMRLLMRAGTAQSSVAKLRRFAWPALAVAREIVAWAWERREKHCLAPAWARAHDGADGDPHQPGVYAGALAMLYVTQRSLIDFPETIHTTPAAGLPQAEEVTLTTADGENLIAWHAAARRQAGHSLSPPQCGALRYRVERFTRPSRRHRHRRGGLSRLWRLERQPEERGLIADAEPPTPGAAARYPAQQIVPRRVARFRRRGGAGGGKTGRPRHPETPFTSAAAVGAKHTGTCRSDF